MQGLHCSLGPTLLGHRLAYRSWSLSRKTYFGCQSSERCLGRICSSFLLGLGSLRCSSLSLGLAGRYFARLLGIGLPLQSCAQASWSRRGQLCPSRGRRSRAFDTP